MPAAALLVSSGLALAISPFVLRGFTARGWTRLNHRGALVAHPAGVAVLATAASSALALGALELATGAALLEREMVIATSLVTGVALLGLADDLLGDRIAGGPRGIRAHVRALARGRASTGFWKAAGTTAMAVGGLALLGFTGPELALAAAVVVLAAHAFNLLDVRPGRSIKTLLALGAVLTLGSLALEPLATLGLVLGPIAVLLVPDLRERAMLGDTGAGAVGTVGGLWIVLTLPVFGQAVALAALVAVAVYGEVRSITGLVRRTPLLRQLDSLGRNHA